MLKVLGDTKMMPSKCNCNVRKIIIILYMANTLSSKYRLNKNCGKSTIYSRV